MRTVDGPADGGKLKSCRFTEVEAGSTCFVFFTCRTGGVGVAAGVKAKGAPDRTTLRLDTDFQEVEGQLTGAGELMPEVFDWEEVVRVTVEEEEEEEGGHNSS